MCNQYKDTLESPIYLEGTGYSCVVCGTVLGIDGSPWSICYDEEYEHNIWGGDSHEYRAYLCQNCATNLILKGGR